MCSWRKKLFSGKERISPPICGHNRWLVLLCLLAQPWQCLPLYIACCAIWCTQAWLLGVSIFAIIHIMNRAGSLHSISRVYTVSLGYYPQPSLHPAACTRLPWQCVDMQTFFLPWLALLQPGSLREKWHFWSLHVYTIQGFPVTTAWQLSQIWKSERRHWRTSEHLTSPGEESTLPSEAKSIRSSILFLFKCHISVFSAQRVVETKSLLRRHSPT